MKTRSSFSRIILILIMTMVLLSVSQPAHISGGSIYREAQQWPIELGTSGGNIYDRSSRYCCSGTLGALVQDLAGYQYILSNNHVLARTNQAQVGEEVNQPGQIDQLCGQEGVVGYLSAFEPIEFKKNRNATGPVNLMDAAIAEVIDGAVRADGAILTIGAVSSRVLAPAIGLNVQKSGRTTGHTQGEIAAVNVTVDVGYSDECGGNANLIARFANQIRITPGTFSAGGDSGSLVVESGGTDPADGLPRAVGLLFAGSSTSTFANPIGPVLDAFGVVMAGGEAPEPPVTGAVAGAVYALETGEPIAGATVAAGQAYSTQTAADGAYMLEGLAPGPATLMASAVGYEPQSIQVEVVGDQVREGVNFALEAVQEPEPGMSYGQCVTYNTNGGRDNNRHMSISVKVTDAEGSPLAGAGVDVAITLDGQPFTTAGTTANSAGEAVFTFNNAPNGLYEVAVTNVAATGLEFEGTTPANAFNKGQDATPAIFCQAHMSGSASGGRSNGANIPGIERARNVVAARSQALFDIPDVVGHGIGVASGKAVAEVYLSRENAQASARAKKLIEDVPVNVIVTGPVTAY